MFGWLIIFLVLTGRGDVFAAEDTKDDIDFHSIPLYEIYVPATATEPVLFRVHMPKEARASEFFFESWDDKGPSLGQLVAITAVDADDRPLTLHMSGPRFIIDGHPARLDYELALHPSITKPDTWPNNRPGSVRWDEYFFINSNALLRWAGQGVQEAYARFHVPDTWTVYAAGDDMAQISDDLIHVSNLHTPIFVGGPDVSPIPETGSARLIPIGPLPWEDDELLSSLSQILLPLRQRGLVAMDAAYDFVLARYPGALRLNPFIGGRSVDEGTLVQWIGIGSKDWWRKHTAADIIAARLSYTLDLAPEARWFKRGLIDYGGLLLLYEAGLLDVDSLYQNVRNMFATAAHYAGPLWPSLIMAGLAEDASHDAERVLQFRAPVVAFLFDLELRERSAGRINLLDWWAFLTTQAGQNGDEFLYNDDLLPPVQTFGDMSAFVRHYLFVSEGLNVHFDDVFDRWLNFANR